jgi:FixJ family two-component response regulator
MNTEVTNVWIVEDDDMFRKSLESLLNNASFLQSDVSAILIDCLESLCAKLDFHSAS